MRTIQQTNKLSMKIIEAALNLADAQEELDTSTCLLDNVNADAKRQKYYTKLMEAVKSYRFEPCDE